MRTIKRRSDALNQGKVTALRLMVSAYAKEKNYWLSIFQQHRYMGYIKKHRCVRDEFVAAKYQSSYREVKNILLHRFHHRLETKQLGTVSGRIPDTHKNRSTGLGQSESEYQKISDDYS